MPYQKGPGKTVVIALGGNALGNTPQEQLELVQNTAKHIVDMIEEGTNVVVSHGNGPQVGMINNAFAYAAANDDKTPDMPFPEAGAMSQGYIGYQLSQAILNDVKAREIPRSTACIVTQTVVDADDPAFQNPTKPVGAFMDEETAKAKAEAMNITVQGGRRPRLAPGGRLPDPQAHRRVRRRARFGGGRLRGRVHRRRRGAGLRDGGRLRGHARGHRQGPLERADGLGASTPTCS